MTRPDDKVRLNHSYIYAGYLKIFRVQRYFENKDDLVLVSTPSSFSQETWCLAFTSYKPLIVACGEWPFGGSYYFITIFVLWKKNNTQ